MNISEPERVVSDEVMMGVDQANECEEGSRDHSPVFEETVG